MGLKMLIVASLCAAAIAAHAEEADTVDAPVEDRGDTMIRACRVELAHDDAGTPLDHIRAGKCLGIVQTLMVIGHHHGKLRFCPPPGATPDQGIRAVLKWLQVRPERTHEYFTILALYAMSEAWPCDTH